MATDWRLPGKRVAGPAMPNIPNDRNRYNRARSLEPSSHSTLHSSAFQRDLRGDEVPEILTRRKSITHMGDLN